jgi:DNA processing protein
MKHKNLEQTLLHSKRRFTDNDKKFILSLLSIDGVGRRSIKKIIYSLIKYELNFEDFWVNKLGIWNKCRLSKKAIDKVKNAKKEYKKCSIYKELKSKGVRVVSFWEKEYPKLLKQCDDFPILIFVKGNIDCLKNEIIGVVGTRRITSYGKLATKRIVEDLVIEEFTIASGFMYGVDICAHLETIASGGITIAVLGFGFDHMYPRSHERYFDQVIQSGGCFITEYLPNQGPIAGNFPSRNRIVAGMSKGVVVIEAAKKSGSHITAECAINEGREVFAVPGPINNPFSEGTKWLINQGATMVTSGNDVVNQLRESFLKAKMVGVSGEVGSSSVAESNKDEIVSGSSTPVSLSDLLSDQENFSKTQKLIIKELEGISQNIDFLAETLSLDVQEIMKEITLLEINGIVNIEGNILSLRL